MNKPTMPREFQIPPVREPIWADVVALLAGALLFIPLATLVLAVGGGIIPILESARLVLWFVVPLWIILRIIDAVMHLRIR